MFGCLNFACALNFDDHGACIPLVISDQPGISRRFSRRRSHFTDGKARIVYALQLPCHQAQTATQISAVVTDPSSLDETSYRALNIVLFDGKEKQEPPLSRAIYVLKSN